MGLVYALMWTTLADRKGAAGDRLSAGFHGAASAIVAYPLIWESVVRFELVSPSVAAAGLAVVAATGLAVAARQYLASLAWMSTVGASLAGVVLILSTRVVTPFATAVALLVGYGGALLAAEEVPTLRVALVAGGLFLAAFCYRAALALRTEERRESRTGWFLVGTGTLTGLLAGAALESPAWLWAPLALTGSWAAARLAWPSLSWQGAVYLFGAAVASGLLSFGAYAFLASANVSWPSPSARRERGPGSGRRPPPERSVPWRRPCGITRRPWASA
jgi:hypothetical protein